MSRLQIKKIIVLKYPVLFYATVNHFSISLWHATKSGFYMTTSRDQLSGWANKKLQSTSQSQTCTKKGHGHCLVVCCLSDPLQLSESWGNHYIWEVCSANTWYVPRTAVPATSIGQQKGPSSPQHLTTHFTTTHCTSWTNWAMKFCLICHIHLISHQRTTTSSSISTTFCRKNASTTSRRQKMLSKSLSNPKARIFTLQE